MGRKRLLLLPSRALAAWLATYGYSRPRQGSPTLYFEDYATPEAAPARGALIALLEMGPPERTQGWFPEQFDHGM